MSRWCIDYFGPDKGRQTGVQTRSLKTRANQCLGKDDNFFAINIATAAVTTTIVYAPHIAHAE